jgi:hypothetical protein
VRETPNGAPLTNRIPAEGPFDLFSGSLFKGDVETPSTEAMCEAARRLNAPADLIVEVEELRPEMFMQLYGVTMAIIQPNPERCCRCEGQSP